MCLVLLLRVVWACKWCISSRVCIAVFSVCILDEPSMCCVCGSIWLRFVVCFLFVTKVTSQTDWSECLFVCVYLYVSSGQDLTRRSPLF